MKIHNEPIKHSWIHTDRCGRDGRFVILQLYNDEKAVGDKEKQQNQACNTQHLHLVGIHTEN